MLNIGILGAAGIAPAAIIRPAERRDDATILAVASRTAASAARYAAAHGIPRHYGDYADLLADPDIQLVYVALPPSEHARWSIAALEAGKDVLCEKPLAMNAVQAEVMVAAADRTGRRLIEAFHDRYHPLSAEVTRIVESGVIGRLVSLDADFSVANPFDPASLRHDPALGGGALMDLGCYPVHWARTVMGSEPTVIGAVATFNPMGADLSIDAALRFGDVRARITARMDSSQPLNNSLDLVGTRGRARIDNLVFPASGHSIRVEVDGLARLSTVQGQETYDHQLAAIVAAMGSGVRLPTEGNDPVDNMRVIDAIYAAAGVSRNVS